MHGKRDKMKLILELSKENLSLAKGEALAVALPRKHSAIKNLLIVETDKKVSGLAYCKAIYKLLFTCSRAKL